MCVDFERKSESVIKVKIGKSKCNLFQNIESNIIIDIKISDPNQFRVTIELAKMNKLYNNICYLIIHILTRCVCVKKDQV